MASLSMSLVIGPGISHGWHATWRTNSEPKGMPKKSCVPSLQLFSVSQLGIPHDPCQHASYVGSWIQVLRKDHNELFRAAKDAERITEFVLQFQKEKTLQQEVGQVTASRRKRTTTAKKRTREVELEC